MTSSLVWSFAWHCHRYSNGCHLSVSKGLDTDPAATLATSRRYCWSLKCHGDVACGINNWHRELRGQSLVHRCALGTYPAQFQSQPHQLDTVWRWTYWVHWWRRFAYWCHFWSGSGFGLYRRYQIPPSLSTYRSCETVNLWMGHINWVAFSRWCSCSTLYSLSLL